MRPARSKHLIAADVLPAGFGRRSDGSQLEFVDGRLTDSMRGGRGTFVPIPDMPLERISPSENQQYQDFLAGAAELGRRPIPVLVGIRKSAGKKSDLEHVVLDVEAAPLSEQHIQYLNRWLGPPATQRLAPIPGDLVHLDAAVRGGTVSQAGDHFIVFGLQDLLPGPLPADERPLLEALKVVIGQSPLRGYLAAWPQPGLLSRSAARPTCRSIRPDTPGCSRESGGERSASSRRCRFIARCWSKSRRNSGWIRRRRRSSYRCASTTWPEPTWPTGSIAKAISGP